MNTGDNTTFPVDIRVAAGDTRGELKPIYRFFGADEPNYATMKDGQKLLRAIGDLGAAQPYFRAHNLLTTGDGTPALKWGSTNAYTENERGDPVYDWSIVDRIFDSYLENSVKPYVQIGFMPRALSARPDPYRHEWRPGFPYEEIFTGWAYPPVDYKKWGELVYNWARHCVDRYGREEVETWYWQVWNEANIGYWQGTPEEFRILHDHAIDGVRRALPSARVGGPDTAGDGGPFMRDFLEHCLRGTNHATGETGTPLDFVSFHAKGQPEFVGDHVRMGMGAQLRDIDRGFARIASYPELKDKPVILGESDPDGCAACQGPQLGYRNGTLYASYTAASFARKHLLAEKHGVNFEGATTWAFEFEDQPYFAGFRALASNGITLPVFNVFRMMARMKGRRIAVHSTADPGPEGIIKHGVRDHPDVSALAALDRQQLAILVWHYHDDDIPGPAAQVNLTVSGLPATAAERRIALTHYRIDEDHSNAFARWKALGSPNAPTRTQYAELESASGLTALTAAPNAVTVKDGNATLAFTIPRQAVSLILMNW